MSTMAARRGSPKRFHFSSEDLDNLTAKEISDKYGCVVRYAHYVKGHHRAKKVGSTAWRHTLGYNHGTYVVHTIPGHPVSGPEGRALEHRLVVYDHMGDSMFVLGSEIHHRNGDRRDNRDENLIWFETPTGHKGLEAWVKSGNDEVEYLATTEHKFEAFCPTLKADIAKWTK